MFFFLAFLLDFSRKVLMWLINRMMLAHNTSQETFRIKLRYNQARMRVTKLNIEGLLLQNTADDGST